MFDCFFKLKAKGTIGGNVIVKFSKFVINRIAIMDNFDRDFNKLIS